jgi:hypothetical protein
MANRSDFFSAKLPRSIKRMMAMAETNGWVKDAHERGDLRRSFITAHAAHVGFKMKRQSNDAGNNEQV